MTAQGVQGFTDSEIGYTIVDATSYDEAVEISSEHPHRGLVRGNPIEVLECPEVPGRST